MNAYGFGSGDPITYSDPFGLCPIPGACALIALFTTPSVVSFVAKHPKAAEVTADAAQVTALVAIGVATDGLGDLAALGDAAEIIEGGEAAAADVSEDAAASRVPRATSGSQPVEADPAAKGAPHTRLAPSQAAMERPVQAVNATPDLRHSPRVLKWKR